MTKVHSRSAIAAGTLTTLAFATPAAPAGAEKVGGTTQLNRGAATVKHPMGLHLLLVAAALLAGGFKSASAQDILVEARNLDHVNNPAELERWWTDVEDTTVVKAIGEAVASYYGCRGCVTAFHNAVNNVVHFSNGPQDFSGAIQSPNGYTVCRAYVMNPSVNCNGTFTGSYRTAKDPHSGGIDGLHWYMVVPRPGLFAGRCWANGTVVVEFARASLPNPAVAKCGETGTIAFHYGR
jgi:hypothetical protein